MIIKCYECSANVSDLASSCPHCGAPLGKNSARLSKWKVFVDEALRTLYKSRSDCSEEVLEKIMSIPESLERLSRFESLSLGVRYGMLLCTSDHSGRLDYSRFWWDGCTFGEKNVIRELINTSLIKYMAEHLGALQTDPRGCRDLLIELTMCEPTSSSWLQASTLDKCLKDFDAVRKYLDDLHAKGENCTERLHDQLLLFCDNLTRQEQDRIIAKMRELYCENSHRCIHCKAQVDDVRYFYRYDIEKYAPADCGRVRFVIDEPRCPECAERFSKREKELGERCKELRERLNEMNRSGWIFRKEEKVEELKAELERAEENWRLCGAEYDHFVVVEEMEKHFSSEEELKQVGHLWCNIVPLRRTYNFSIPIEDDGDGRLFKALM